MHGSIADARWTLEGQPLHARAAPNLYPMHAEIMWSVFASCELQGWTVAHAGTERNPVLAIETTKTAAGITEGAVRRWRS